jgi:hypothetical protein
MGDPLSVRLVGSWELISRIDRAQSGEQRLEPTLGSDPIAFLVFDRAGNFAAQFMKRERLAADDAPSRGGANNTRARDGYDAYFGTFTVDEKTGMASHRITAALSRDGVGRVLTRQLSVDGDILTIELDTTTADGEPVRRTLRWQRVA